MRQNEKDKKKYVIVGLCAILVVMAVGYASFASNLMINGTSEITSNWCLGFDNTKTNALVPSKTHAIGQNPTGTISYDGGTCGVKSQFGANISAHLNQPGDSIEYTLTILNEGSLDAKIDSIIVGEDSVTSDTKIAEGNVIFDIKMPASTSVGAGESTTMKVVATFQDVTDITGTYGGENQSINVKINASQDDGSGGMNVTPAAQTVYAINANSIYKDTSSLEDVGQTYSSCSATGKNVCLKYTIEDDKVVGVDVCFMKGGSESCLKGWVDESSLETKPVFNSNKSVLQSAFTEENACDDYGSRFGCDASDDWGGGVSDDGDMNVYAGDWVCPVDSGGSAYCDGFGG